ncbi:hypothetical protein GCM10009079_32130 [Ralstonia mannitolilytica]
MAGKMPRFQRNGALYAAAPAEQRGKVVHAAGADELALDRTAHSARARQQLPQTGAKPCR